MPNPGCIAELWLPFARPCLPACPPLHRVALEGERPAVRKEVLQRLGAAEALVAELAVVGERDAQHAGQHIPACVRRLQEIGRPICVQACMMYEVMVALQAGLQYVKHAGQHVPACTRRFQGGKGCHSICVEACLYDVRSNGRCSSRLAILSAQRAGQHASACGVEECGARIANLVSAQPAAHPGKHRG